MSGCGGTEPGPPGATGPTTGSTNGPVEVIVVNYELVADQSNRVLIGLVLPDGRFVAYGSVQMRFTQLDDGGQPIGQTSQVVRGTYIPVPGTEPGDPNADPQATSPARARGAYELEGVQFNVAGPWAVEVATQVQGVGPVQGAAQLSVLASPSVPGIGQGAPRSDNPVIGDEAVDPVEIDSRASVSAKIPDPELHRVSIADAIRSNNPAVVVFSTPVYCVSRFCGPVTDMVQSLAETYRGRADFIHVEVWRDFQNNIVSDAANEWLNRGGTLNEPWLFVVGANGKIQARWDNLFTSEEVAPVLEELLPSK